MDTIKQIWEGKAGLARTYWGWGVLGSIPWAVVLSLVTPGSTVAIATVLAALLAYLLVVNVGIWRAASAYTGTAASVVLAKIAAVLGLLTAMAVLTLIVAALSGRNLVAPGAAPQAATTAPHAPYASPPGFKPFHGKLDGESGPNCKSQIDDFLDNKIDHLDPACRQSHAPSTDKDGKPCSEITEFLGECKRQP